MTPIYAPGDYRLRTLEMGGECDIGYDGGGFPRVVIERNTVTAGAASEAESRIEYIAERE